MNEKINCQVYENILQVNNLEEYYSTKKERMDTIKIKFKGYIGKNSGKMLPLEIYTYKDEFYREKVDQNT